MRKSFHYVVAGRGLVSDVPLPELSDSVGFGAPLAPVRVAFAPQDEPVPQAGPWFFSWPSPEETGGIWLQFAALNGGYLLEFPGFGRYLISGCGNLIRCFPAPDVPEATSRHLLLDQVLPLALGMKGDVVLHAGAVAFGDRSLALIGPSGHGKSTMVAHLGTRGAEVLADDCVVLRRIDNAWHAIPFYPGLRLWPQSLQTVIPGRRTEAEVACYTVKKRVSAHNLIRFRRSPAPLRMILFLGGEPQSAGPAALTQMVQREAFLSMLTATFFFEISRKLALRNQFDLLGRLVDEVPAYVLDYRRQFEILPSVGAIVLSAFSQEWPVARRPRETSVPGCC